TRNATIKACGKENLVTLSLDKGTFQALMSTLDVHFGKRTGITSRATLCEKVMLQSQHRNSLQSMQKSPSELAFITSVLAARSLFSQLDEVQLKAVAEQMWLCNYGENQVVALQGHLELYFMIVADGKVDQIDDSHDNAVLQTSERGTVIGELSLMHNEFMNFTYKTRTACKIWVIARTTFRKLIQETSEEKRKEYVNFLRSVPVFGKTFFDV
ncbi:cGMP-dependent protein kinase, isozyme, partial [Reticulomyxa filosa]